MSWLRQCDIALIGLN